MSSTDSTDELYRQTSTVLCNTTTLYCTVQTAAVVQYNPTEGAERRKRKAGVTSKFTHTNQRSNISADQREASKTPNHEVRKTFLQDQLNQQ